MLKVKNVIKNYKKVNALKNISFEVKEGEIFGLLGPNGAGKSTMIKCISGLEGIDGGAIEIFGTNSEKHRKAISQQMGIVPQDIAVVEELSAYENCMFIGALYGLKGSELKARVKEALEFVDLWDRRKDIPGKYSGGMKRRLNIACALVHKPKLIIMDEPTVGVDPQSRNHILQSIKKLNKEGTTVIYTSHYMEEVEELCDRIAIIDLGSKIAEGTLEELVGEVSQSEIVNIDIKNDIKSNDDRLKKLMNLRGVLECTLEKNGLIVKSEKGAQNLMDIIKYMNENGMLFDSINMIKPSLEQVFLEKTGKSLRD